MQKELRQISESMMVCFKETMPTKQFTATITLAVVSLHVLAARIQKTQNLEERSKMLNAFSRKKEKIKKGIRILRQRSSKRPRERQYRSLHFL
jgi:hypothetical protein